MQNEGSDCHPHRPGVPHGGPLARDLVCDIAIGTTFVDIFRGAPLLVQAFFSYFGIPSTLGFQIRH